MHLLIFGTGSKFSYFYAEKPINMDPISKVLYSDYFIDGVPADSCPGKMLDAECGRKSPELEKDEPIVDESVDPLPASGSFDPSEIPAYLKLTSAFKGPRTAKPAYAAAFTRSRIAQAVLGMMWQKGHFKLEDVAIKAHWKWNTGPIGGPASFYESVEAACDYVDGIGVHFEDYTFSEASKNSLSVRCKVVGQPSDEETAEPDATQASLGRGRKCPGTIGECSTDWLIYIPFDSGDFHLGNSLLSELTGKPAGHEAEIEDPDYFIDCFEVVRELVEDGVVIAGSTVGDGGLITALNGMTAGGNGSEINLAGLSEAYKDSDKAALLFAEVPGVVVEIRDQDFDYIDAELLLQDVAYYPIGHPVPGKPEIEIGTGNGGLPEILRSLLGDGAREGED